MQQGIFELVQIPAGIPMREVPVPNRPLLRVILGKPHYLQHVRQQQPTEDFRGPRSCLRCQLDCGVLGRTQGTYSSVGVEIQSMWALLEIGGEELHGPRRLALTEIMNGQPQRMFIVAVVTPPYSVKNQVEQRAAGVKVGNLRDPAKPAREVSR